MKAQLSKSEKKRRAKALEQLVIELAGLSPAELENLPCGEEFRGELAAAKPLKGGARKRQLKYAARLLRDKPIEELYDFLAQQKGSHLKEKKEFHQLEYFRDLLISEAIQSYEERKHQDGYLGESEPEGFLDNSETIDMITKHLPLADQDLLKNTAMQFARTRNRKFSRELFRLLKAALEKGQFTSQ